MCCNTMKLKRQHLLIMPGLLKKDFIFEGYARNIDMGHGIFADIMPFDIV